MAIEVVPYSPRWPLQFDRLAAGLRSALAGVPAQIEHVGSTAVPGLAAKPIIDVDVIVAREQLVPAIEALERVGYSDRGDLGVTDREAFTAPDENPAHHVYACVAGTLHIRNHLTIRDALRADPRLRDRYAAVKLELAGDPEMDIGRYIAAKSAVLQEVLAVSDLTADEKRLIFELNNDD
ncbi:GrpB family protein [Micrococcaceae bacterium RIT802]|nr:GrpB family protein [Micrococcaceae bacterium RIT 802]